MTEFIVTYWYWVLAAIVTGFLFFRNLLDIAPAGTVSTAEATHLINRQHAVVLDVRTPEEFKAGHLTNAVNIPVEGLEARVGELKKYKTKPIIIVCEYGKRAEKARRMLHNTVAGEVYCLRGGLKQWKEDNLPIVV